MRSLLLAGAVIGSLASHAAYAGEGNGDPFPFRAPGVTTVFNGYKAMPPNMADPFPFRARGTIVTQADSDRMLPVNGSEGPVQSANSLPKGFEDGTTAFMLARPASPAAASVAQVNHARTHG